VTPHHAQRLAVSAALGPLAAHCTVDTVERMQGRERDLVIVCLVGLDLNGDDDGVELDFVYDACRIVVALTRAKKKCVVLATARLFDSSMHVFDTPARREAYRLLLGVRAYADARGSVVARALAAPIDLAPVVPAPAPAPPPPTPSPPPAAPADEELVDLSQALSLDDGHVTTPDSDDETLEDVPSPTKRDRTESDDGLATWPVLSWTCYATSISRGKLYALRLKQGKIFLQIGSDCHWTASLVPQPSNCGTRMQTCKVE
jgi:hypothetical protein